MNYPFLVLLALIVLLFVIMVILKLSSSVNYNTLMNKLHVCPVCGTAAGTATVVTTGPKPPVAYIRTRRVCA